MPLNVTVRKVLSDYLEVHPAGEWLFLSQRGKRLSTRAAERVVGKYAGLAGIAATPHQLRHNFCKGLVDAGVSLDKVAVLAGHSNLNTTAKYVRPSVQDLERAVDRLGVGVTTAFGRAFNNVVESYLATARLWMKSGGEEAGHWDPFVYFYLRRTAGADAYELQW